MTDISVVIPALNEAGLSRVLRMMMIIEELSGAMPRFARASNAAAINLEADLETC